MGKLERVKFQSGDKSKKVGIVNKQAPTEAPLTVGKARKKQLPTEQSARTEQNYRRTSQKQDGILNG